MAFAPIYADGFDNYSVGRQRWTIGPEAWSTGTGNSRHAWGRGMGFGYAQSPAIEMAPLPSMIIEGAFKLKGRNWPQSHILRLGKMDLANNFHCSFMLTESRHVYFRREQDSTVLAGPTIGPEHVVEFNNWYWFQMKAIIHDTDGYMEFRVNNHLWLAASNLDTYNTIAGIQIIDLLNVGGAFPQDEWDVDDIVVQDGATGEFQGDMIVLGKRPADVGYISQFTPSGAATGWEATDEVTADEDTTHAASDTIGERDSYLLDKITEVPESSIVLGVQQAFRHRKDEPGPRSVVAFTRVDTDEFLGEERFPSESAYLTSIEAVQLTQPDGVSAWGTVGEFNALDVEIGQEVTDGFDDES